jgi:hypothetical protein
MPKMIIANVDSAAMCGSRRDELDYAHSAMSAQRLLATVTDEDVVLLPQMPAEEFLAYSNELLGRSLSEKNVVVPRRGRQDGLIWTYEALNDGDVAAQIEARAGSVAGWDLLAYFLDRPVLALAESLQLRIPAASTGFLRAGGAESLNSKAVFREIADSAGTPVAAGRVVSSASELAHAVRDLLDATGHVIVKQDLNLGGAGNTVLTLSDTAEFTGARTTVNLSGIGAVDDAAAVLWPQVAVDRNTRAVVETYHPTERVLYSELFVHGPGRAPELLNFGEMRMEPVFIGFEMPTQAVGVFDAATMAAHSMDLARAAGERGFRGYMNIDSLLTTTGRLLFTEVNGRMGACTHIDVLARELVGPRYQATHVLLTRNRVQVPSLTASLRALEQAGLGFDHGRGEGCVVAAEGVAATGTLEYLIFAPDLDRARELELRTEATLAALARRADAA